MKKLIITLILASLLFLIEGIAQAETTQSIQITTQEVSLSDLGDWQTSVAFGNARIDGEIFEANPTDSAAYLFLNNPDVTENTVAVTFEFDGSLNYSQWGQGILAYVKMSNNNSYQVFSNMNDCCSNAGLHQIVIKSSEDSNITYTKDLVFGLFHYKILFSESKITVTIEDSDGFTVFQKTTNVTGLEPSDFNKFGFKLNTTTSNSIWIKNIVVGIVDEI